MTKRRRVMREFRINEISAVDNPAQVGAKAVLMKAHREPSSRFMWDDEDDLIVSEPKAPWQPESMKSARQREDTDMSRSNLNFDEVVDRIQDTDKCDRCTAMRKAADLYPETLKAYRAWGDEQQDIAKAKAKGATRRPKAEEEFNQKVDELRYGRKISRVEAMQLARKLYPEMVDKLRAA